MTIRIAPGSTSFARTGYLLGSFGNGFTVGNLHSAPLVFTVKAGPTKRMRITSSGDVGIGTPSPAAKLEVAGNVKATGSNSVMTCPRSI